MKRRIHLRKKHVLFDKTKKRRKRNLLLLILVILMIVLFFAFQFMNRILTPVLRDYAEAEMKKISNLIVNQSMSKETLQEMNIDNLYVIHKNDSGIITSIDLNSGVVNQILGEITRKVSKDFKLMESGKVEQLTYYQDIFSDTISKKALSKGVIFYIPTGIVFQNVFFSNLGPKVPVRFHLTGDIGSNLKTKITNYGINNALLEIDIHLEITQMLILPFSSKPLKIEANYPLAVKMVEGTVPESYFNGMNNNSPSVSLPIS